MKAYRKKGVRPSATFHISIQFHSNRLSSFCIILLTEGQTNKQTDVGENITSLAELIKENNESRSMKVKEVDRHSCLIIIAGVLNRIYLYKGI